MVANFAQGNDGITDKRMAGELALKICNVPQVSLVAIQTQTQNDRALATQLSKSQALPRGSPLNNNSNRKSQLDRLHLACKPLNRIGLFL